MKFHRLVTAFLLLIILSAGTLIILGRAQAADSSPAPEASQQANSATTATAIKPAVKVTVASVSKDTVSWTEMLGTVKANDQIKIFGTGAGQLQSVLVQEGAAVKAGDPLFVIGGLNGTKAAARIQLEIAQKSFMAAQKGLDITKKGNSAALAAAQLTLQSAQHQAEGSYLDLQVFDQNIAGVQNGISYLRDSFNATARNNELNFEKTQNGIDDLKDAINKLEEQKSRLENLSNEQSGNNDQQAAQQSSGGSGASQASSGGAAATDLPTQIAELDKTLEDLYSQLETAKIGYEQLEQARSLSENALMGQISTAESSGKVLYLNQIGMEKKLGLEDGSSDPVKLAEVGLNAARIKNEASLVTAQTQLDLARSNLELAQAQADGLIVKAPVNGIMGEILAHTGDIVSQQTMLTQVYGQKDFELRVAVDMDSADLISAGSYAEVEIGGKYIKLPVKSVAVTADAATRMVNITVALPKINFRANQTLRVRIPLSNTNAAQGNGGFYIPLDAVVIGTEEQYVFIDENGAAKRVNVKTGDIHGDQVQILEGLSESDKVIVQGAKTLIEGEKVTLQ